MDLSTLYKTLHILTNSRIVKSDIARILSIDPAQLRRKEVAGIELKQSELKAIADSFDISLQDLINQENINKLIGYSAYSTDVPFSRKISDTGDIIKIPYWSGLPDELKHPEYTYVLAQKASIEQGWNLIPGNLCITVMNGDAMENYWYKIRNNDVLIIDTNETKVNANGCGVYFATSRNNTMFWIREMQALYNGDIEFHSYAPSGIKTKVLTEQQLKESDFRIIGKVIKNVSFRL